MTAEAYPFRTAIEQEERDGQRVFSWATDNPPLHARYRLVGRHSAQTAVGCRTRLDMARHGGALPTGAGRGSDVRVRVSALAEGVGFEPTSGCPEAVSRPPHSAAVRALLTCGYVVRNGAHRLSVP